MPREALGAPDDDGDQHQPRGEGRRTLVRGEPREVCDLATELEVEEEKGGDREDHGCALARG
jgi:hypothetical protein